MTKNRSVPADILLPHLVYDDVGAALEWLTRTFGFTEHYRFGEPGEPLNGAQIHLGDAWVMLRRAEGEERSPAKLGSYTQSLTVFVEDVEAHYEKAKAAGADIVEELNVAIYGERQYGVKDLDGHHWLFSAHARDVDPAEWGAQVAES